MFLHPLFHHLNLFLPLPALLLSHLQVARNLLRSLLIYLLPQLPHPQNLPYSLPRSVPPPILHLQIVSHRLHLLRQPQRDCPPLILQSQIQMILRVPKYPNQFHYQVHQALFGLQICQNLRNPSYRYLQMKFHRIQLTQPPQSPQPNPNRMNLLRHSPLLSLFQFLHLLHPTEYSRVRCRIPS